MRQERVREIEGVIDEALSTSVYGMTVLEAKPAHVVVGAVVRTIDISNLNRNERISLGKWLRMGADKAVKRGGVREYWYWNIGDNADSVDGVTKFFRAWQINVDGWGEASKYLIDNVEYDINWWQVMEWVGNKITVKNVITIEPSIRGYDE